jgi:drug/metabolite transporter (DMT)-like permease
LNQNLKSHLAIIGANIIWGLNYVVAKGIMPDFLLPRAVVFLRISGTVILVWILHFIIPSEKVEKKDLFKMALCSVFGVVVNQILFFEGLNRTTPISASIIATGIPIYILIFSHFLLKETITGVKVLGIMIGATGALMIILSAGTGDFRFNTLLGNILIFANNTCWALYLVLLKPLMEKYDTLTIMKWTFLFGFIIIFPFSFKIAASSSFAQMPFNIWMSVLFVVFITSGFAYCLVNYSLKTVSPNVNGIYIYLQPLVATIVAIIFRNDKFTIIDLIAAVLIMSGVYFVSRQPNLKTYHLLPTHPP